MSTVKKRLACRKKFLKLFPGGFHDTKYYNWERDYKWNAHLRWQKHLNKKDYESLLANKKYTAIAKYVVNLESKTNLLFSFEKMSLRDAVKIPADAKLFAEGLYEYIYGKASKRERFEQFVDILAQLPQKQTRVLTWPITTVFGFIADPKNHLFLKPKTTKVAAEKYDFDFDYKSKPNWKTYCSLMSFGKLIRLNIGDLEPRDNIDIQSYIWVIGSDEYS